MQCETYYIAPDRDYKVYQRDQGLAHIKTFAVQVHFDGSQEQIDSMNRFQKETGLDVYTLTKDSAIVVKETEIELIGNAKKYEYKLINKHKDDIMNFQKLFEHFKLGRITEEPEKIDGGLMHIMYKVKTTTKQYALKRLNPEIMKRKGVLQHITVSERIGQLFKDLVPAISALTIDHSPIFHYEDDDYIIFEWIEGNSIFPPDISIEHCSIVGELLGRIHTSKIDIPDLQQDISDMTIYPWDKFLKLGEAAELEWVTALQETIYSLKLWNKQLISSKKRLSERQVISHRDLDPKNVMWHQSKPYLIDWEAAGYVNPYQELLELLNYWADNGEGNLDYDRFKALYDAYKLYDTCDNVNWEDVVISGYDGMLGWLNYSFKRSLGIEAENKDERALGTKQVLGTIQALKRYNRNVKYIKEWLEEK